MQALLAYLKISFLIR